MKLATSKPFEGQCEGTGLPPSQQALLPEPRLSGWSCQFELCKLVQSTCSISSCAGSGFRCDTNCKLLWEVSCPSTAGASSSLSISQQWVGKVSQTLKKQSFSSTAVKIALRRTKDKNSAPLHHPSHLEQEKPRKAHAAQALARKRSSR